MEQVEGELKRVTENKAKHVELFEYLKDPA